MDLTGFEPAPATLTGCRASLTPQAHAYDGSGEKCELHVYPSHPGAQIPKVVPTDRFRGRLHHPARHLVHPPRPGHHPASLRVSFSPQRKGHKCETYLEARHSLLRINKQTTGKIFRLTRLSVVSYSRALGHLRRGWLMTISI